MSLLTKTYVGLFSKVFGFKGHTHMQLETKFRFSSQELSHIYITCDCSYP